MKSRASGSTRQRTRRAILEGMVDVIMETDGIGFSVQAVADRARVTHRTIYNHFPTREALCDAFSDYVDELLMATSGGPEPTWSLASIPLLVEDLYRTLALRDRHARAYVMLMIGNRRPMSAWRNRSLMAEKVDSPHCSVSRCQPIVETNIRMTAVTCRGVSGTCPDCSRAMSFSAISERLRQALIGRRFPIISIT